MKSISCFWLQTHLGGSKGSALRNPTNSSLQLILIKERVSVSLCCFWWKESFSLCSLWITELEREGRALVLYCVWKWNENTAINYQGCSWLLHPFKAVHLPPCPWTLTCCSILFPPSLLRIVCRLWQERFLLLLDSVEDNCSTCNWVIKQCVAEEKSCRSLKILVLWPAGVLALG